MCAIPVNVRNNFIFSPLETLKLLSNQYVVKDMEPIVANMIGVVYGIAESDTHVPSREAANALLKTLKDLNPPERELWFEVQWRTFNQ